MQEKFRRRRLPHWDVPGATYFITACLAGSIPAEGILDISGYRTSLAKRPRPDQFSEDEWKTHCWKLNFARCDEWLDRRPGTRHLADPSLAAIVVDSFYFFAGERYDLLAYVVMPSHIHWVFRARQEWAEKLSDDRSPREVIMHSLKLHTALECNKRLQLTGAFWQDESHDHCISDEDELWRIIEYVELNPVRAGLAAFREMWPFSSGHDRTSRGISFGQPLLRP